MEQSLVGRVGHAASVAFVRRSVSVAFLVALVGLASDVAAITRPEILARAREFTTISWAIADTALALHDAPPRRYWETGQCNRHSPLVEWIQNYQGGNWNDAYGGAAYAYGGRHTPSETSNWLASGVGGPIGQCLQQWQWRIEHNKYPYAFAGNDDCVGVAGFATRWRNTRTQDTEAMLTDAQNPDGYYVQLCRGACSGTPNGYEEPQPGDVLVKPRNHCFVWVSGSWAGGSSFIEGTGNAAYERAVERTDSRGFEDWLNDGYWAICIRSLHENPKCSFRRVWRSSADTVEWETSSTSNTWGFAVTVSTDDGITWRRVGEYVRSESADTNEPTRWVWRGSLPPTGLLRIVEIEADSQQLKQSQQTLVLEAFSSNSGH